MNKSAWFAFSMLCVASAAASAHAHLTGSDPSEGSTVKPPAQIVLSFSEPARLTLITLQRAGAPAQKLPLPAAAAARHAVAVSALAAGSYTLTWRALASDGHVTAGAVHFAVSASGNGPPPAPHGGL
jgi:methionine-rich copper-binding protein CopC